MTDLNQFEGIQPLNSRQMKRVVGGSDNKEFHFSIPTGSGISVNPGNLVSIVFGPTGDVEKQAIIIDVGGTDE